MSGASAIAAPAPGDLAIVQALVNTRRLRPESEELATPQDLADWLAERRLLDAGVKLDAADLRRFRHLRENLRGLLRVNNGARLSDGFVDAMKRMTAVADVHLSFRPDGEIHFAHSAAGIDGAVGGLLLIIAFAQRDKSWRRLKVCVREDCRQAYYDASRNLSRRWCAPRCGNEFAKQASRRRLGGDW